MEKQKTITYFLYCRKSTDETDRQILSLDSQESEAVQRFGNLKIIKLPHESVSAFEPEKRPVFRDMIERIKKGEAQGIIAWHPDRLSRNPIDAGMILRLLDTGAIKDLKFCSYYFDNSPEGKMMLQITLSQSKYSSDKLSKDVKRGMDKKAKTGWRPGLAALGYKNSKTGIKGEQTIYNDPERFQLVKQTWQLLLTGNYSVPQILELVNEEWKLTQPGTKKRPERKLQLSKLYRMFCTEFYYGWYQWNGEWIKGNHEPMITSEEYDRAQIILGRKGKPRPKTHLFAYTGLMKCGYCGATVVMEEKIRHQKNGNVHRHIYVRCSKRFNKKIGMRCPEKYIELKDFEKQVDQAISQITIPEKLKNWAIKYLNEVRTNEARSHEDIIETKHKRHESVVKQIDNLLLKYTSPENSEGQMMTNAEYLNLRTDLLKEKNKLETELNSVGQTIEEWLELSERTFNFVRYAKTWFEQGDLNTKRAIFSCLGSHLSVKDKKVVIPLKKPFQILFDGLSKAQTELSRLEPIKIAQNRAEFAKSVSKFPLMSG